MRSKLLVTFSLLLSLISINSARAYTFFDPEAEFLDFDHLIEIFGRPNKEAIYIINDTDCPLEILKAEIADKGTIKFPQLHDALSTFEAKVKNKTNKRILTYQLFWSERHPFERYVNHKIITNSVNVLKPGGTQKLKFTRDKYYRDDAYYEVMVSKILFDDETTWESKNEAIMTQNDQIKKEIDAINEKSIDQMNKDELEKKFNSTDTTPAQITPTSNPAPNATTPGSGTTTQSDSYQGL